jgi:uncharacterized protein YbjT (DUF2867 family)
VKILVVGANGYIGKRLLVPLIEKGFNVTALVRNASRLNPPDHIEHKIKIFEADLLNKASLVSLDNDFDAVYYLVHSMSDNNKSFKDLEHRTIRNLIECLKKRNIGRIIFLTGLYSDKEVLSDHLKSRKNVEDIICRCSIPYTILKAGIIIGSGSASFEMIRDLAEKLSVMIAPIWLNSRCQPIAVYDVIYYLVAVLENEKCKNKKFDIGGPEILTYKSMLLGYAKARKLNRYILRVPFLSPKISALWIGFFTAVNYSLAKRLIASIVNNTICKDHQIDDVINHKCLKYNQAIVRALHKIEQNEVVSGWKDSFVMSRLTKDLDKYIQIPSHGCVHIRHAQYFSFNKRAVIKMLWQIGGSKGWYSYNFVWKLRGWIDKLCGGVGLKRGRTHLKDIKKGDALDFWRVLIADHDSGRLLLFAEMKAPGEAWLEFDILEKDNKKVFYSCATFRPKGVLGRLYWYSLYPIHVRIFTSMAKNIFKSAHKHYHSKN